MEPYIPTDYNNVVNNLSPGTFIFYHDTGYIINYKGERQKFIGYNSVDKHYPDFTAAGYPWVELTEEEIRLIPKGDDITIDSSPAILKSPIKSVTETVIKGSSRNLLWIGLAVLAAYLIFKKKKKGKK